MSTETAAINALYEVFHRKNGEVYSLMNQYSGGNSRNDFDDFLSLVYQHGDPFLKEVVEIGAEGTTYATLSQFAVEGEYEGFLKGAGKGTSGKILQIVNGISGALTGGQPQAPGGGRSNQQPRQQPRQPVQGTQDSGGGISSSTLLYAGVGLVLFLLVLFIGSIIFKSVSN